MKKNKMLTLMAVLLAMGATNAVFGQYDDLYYDPTTDSDYYYDNSSSSEDSYAYNDDDDYGYDDDEYEYEDNEYYYSSRIRRFHRPYYGFSYFDPVYVDRYYYDPFYFNDPFYYPGTTVLIYDNYYPGFRRNRWNWGMGWNSWSGPSFYFSNSSFYNPWRSPWYDPWYGGNTYIVNNYYGGGYYGGGYYGGGYYNNYYCPPSWGNGYSYNTVSNNTYYGSRQSGSTRPDHSPRKLTAPANDNPVNTSDRQGSVQPREATTNTRPSRGADDTRSNAQPNVTEPRESIRTNDENQPRTRSEREVIVPPRTTENERSTIDNRRSRNNGRVDDATRNQPRTRNNSIDNSRSNDNRSRSEGINNNRSNPNRSGGLNNSRSNDNRSRSGSFDSGRSNNNSRSNNSSINSGSSRSNNSGNSSRSSGSSNNSSRSRGRGN